jgi:hypothetical protein
MLWNICYKACPSVNLTLQRLSIGAYGEYERIPEFFGKDDVGVFFLHLFFKLLQDESDVQEHLEGHIPMAREPVSVSLRINAGMRGPKPL